ncbi:MAG: single-stranded DNA-binding protein [Halanaerobiales bacterium]|nr:single-stranded DNA-binding protein [Halanaerobiales bacterium]
MYNSVTLIGHIGGEPENIVTKTGTPMAKISLATSSKVKGEKISQWHDVKCFGKTAENVLSYLHKGSKCLVNGSIEYTTSEKDGVTRYYTSITAFNVLFLDSKNDGKSFDGGTGKHLKIDAAFASDTIPF